MSWNPSLDPDSHLPTDISSLETVIVPRARDIGEFEVMRALPSAKRQMVGPFIFFDQMGPVEFLTGQGIDVRPHPHIGLGTVTYLFQGAFEHRDSVGSQQMIFPGDVNWMVAGNGVTHSERAAKTKSANDGSLFGIQTWLALPEEKEDVPASFEHHNRLSLPLLEAEGKTLRLVMGNAYGEVAPVSAFSDLFYIHAILEPFAKLPLPDEHEDRAIYVLEGQIEVAGSTYEPPAMLIFKPNDKISVQAGPLGATLMLLGGATMSGSRFIKWNFVSSSKEKIEQAARDWDKGDWTDGRFTLPKGDDDDFVPLPNSVRRQMGLID